ncbi:gluconate 2-dehydrogenase gamma chain [Virgibacillus halotolerans]|uniref:gluconate 2-dehydrogenase subunit 3 family protein n=1 Tax=Virgibacillus halotolerans TaxID=1071053 RepID=UPI00196148D6|nr:gluconate 2-dehydrogenase subunit 3 family protein [Virgibacillus halotolerans]MBM7600858.1 gluconate 2-dehydrogenase gamma chain [Virgibacillus halotolerans]
MVDSNKPQGPEDHSRRKFIRNSGIAVGGIVVGGALGSLIPTKQKDKDQSNAEKPINYNDALMFFTMEQFQTTEAATERIFPEDELGPGAKGLGVAYYIDHQLAGPWGMNAKDYMEGPAYNAEATQGTQTLMRRADVFAIGLKGLDDYSNKKYENKFTELTAEEQDDVLQVFDVAKEFKLSGATTKQFFELLRSMTIEGAYSDPLYGGNKNMAGWKMRDFPGSQMGYTEAIMNKEFVKIEPQSLREHMG